MYAPDLRGRGRSDGERFYVEHFGDYVSDVASLVSLVRSREPALPVFLLGHSAGGVVACLYAVEHGAQLAGLICESFAFEVPTPDFVLAVLKGLTHLAPHAHVLRLKNEDFSRDPEVVAEMNADPLIANEVQAANTVAEMVRADERLKLEFPLVSLPLFILHGTEDRAAKPSGSRLFHGLAGSTDKTLKLRGSLPRFAAGYRQGDRCGRHPWLDQGAHSQSKSRFRERARLGGRVGVAKRTAKQRTSLAWKFAATVKQREFDERPAQYREGSATD